LGHSIEDSAPARVERWSGPVGTTHCYGLSGSVLRFLVPYLKAVLGRPPGAADGGPMDVDGAYSRFRASMPQLTTWIAMPSICSQAPFVSDIATRRWFDRAPLLRKMAAVARAVKRSGPFQTAK
jgi:hypothetical protein